MSHREDTITFNIIKLSRLYRLYNRIEIIKDNKVQQYFDLTPHETQELTKQLTELSYSEM